ncbi:hypothetical protein [Acetobacterium sp.]|uniref:hypothetical protein n=1 Tax=Acetobacterium sp. TaxID=1872094 RepID=UPI002F3FC0DB
MVKIGFPKDFGKIKNLFPEKEKEQDLYIAAENTETSELFGAVRFSYKKEQVDIFEMIMVYQGEDSMAIFDGIIRTLLFKMADEECTTLVVRNAQGECKKYFEDHGFKIESGNLVHHSFPGEFFKPCSGCSGK